MPEAVVAVEVGGHSEAVEDPSEAGVEAGGASLVVAGPEAVAEGSGAGGISTLPTRRAH